MARPARMGMAAMGCDVGESLVFRIFVEERMTKRERAKEQKRQQEIAALEYELRLIAYGANGGCDPSNPARSDEAQGA